MVCGLYSGGRGFVVGCDLCSGGAVISSDGGGFVM